MIMLCLTRTISAAAVAFAVILVTGCDGHSVAEYRGESHLAAVSPGTASDIEILPDRTSSDTAQPVEDGAERMLQLTLVELHHFNVYKNFRAMLDASSGTRDDATTSVGAPPTPIRKPL